MIKLQARLLIMAKAQMRLVFQLKGVKSFLQY